MNHKISNCLKMKHWLGYSLKHFCAICGDYIATLGKLDLISIWNPIMEYISFSTLFMGKNVTYFTNLGLFGIFESLHKTAMKWEFLSNIVLQTCSFDFSLFDPHNQCNCHRWAFLHIPNLHRLRILYMYTTLLLFPMQIRDVDVLFLETGGLPHQVVLNMTVVVYAESSW